MAPNSTLLHPSGSDIHLKGIEPDITVEASETSTNDGRELTVSKVQLDPETDVQLKTASKSLQTNLVVPNNFLCVP